MEKEIEIAGKKIFYRAFGSGKPVMLVHGFGETGDVWSNQVDFLKDKFQLIVPDLPGSGRSEMIDDMSMEGMAEALKDILDKEVELPGGEVSLVGHSMGGYITLAFVEKYESLLHSFGLFHSTAFPDSEEKKAARQKSIEFIKEHGAFEFLKTSTPNLFAPRSKEKTPDMVNKFVQSLSGFTPEALISYYEAMMKRPDRTQVLKNAKIPLLLVLGQHDTAVPIEDGLKQCSMADKTYFHLLHESGHMGMFEEVDKSNRLLEDFLSEV